MQTIPAHRPSAPTVSIIVPIYNVEKYLAKCLDSIVRQTHQNLQIILVDDGSTDGSGNLAEDFALKDPRITVVHQKNQGQSAARNTGLSLATGDFVSFVDSDDEIKPDFIKTMLSLYDKPNTSIAVCGHEYRFLHANETKYLYQSELRPRRKNETNKLFILKLLVKDGRMYSCNNKLFKLAPIVKSKLRFDTHINFAEDTKFVLHYLDHTHGEIAYTPKPLYVYNSGTEGSTMRSVATKWSNWQRSYRDLKTWLGPHPSPRERFFLHLVHLRWRISHFKQLLRAKIAS